MSPAEAITRMLTEVDELERKQLLRPSMIAAKRQWVQCVADALAEQQQHVEQLQAQLHQQEQQQRDADLRIGMLANVLTILGFNPMPHLRRPLHGGTYSNPDVYQLAAELQDQHDRQSGLSNRMQLVKHLRQMGYQLNRALWHARLTLMLAPYEQLIQKQQATHGQEERTAA